MTEQPSDDHPGDDDRRADVGESTGGFEFGAVDDEPSTDDSWDRVPITPDNQGEPADEPPANAEGMSDAADPYGPEPRSTPVLAGTPSLENAVFVLIGAVAMILVIARVVSIAFA